MGKVVRCCDEEAEFRRDNNHDEPKWWRRRVLVVPVVAKESSCRLFVASPARSPVSAPGERRTRESGRAAARAVVARLPAGVLDCRGRRRPNRDRLVESLGWYEFRRIDDRSSRRSRRPDHACGNRGLPHCGAIAPRATATALRSRLPPGPPLHGVERDARRASRDGAQPLICRGCPQIHPVDCRAEDRPTASLACDCHDPCGDGRVQLARALRESPRPECSGASTSYTIRRRT